MPDRLGAVLEAVVRSPILHARWLNTFSMLEQIGFRKIVVSQGQNLMDSARLAHAIEEGRHALLLKKLAIKTGGHRFDNYNSENLLCGEEAKKYFHTLDYECLRTLQGGFSEETCKNLTYLYVTWLVEVRALSVYQVYVDALSETGKLSPLKALMAEEDRHLDFVTKTLIKADRRFSDRQDNFKIIEDSLYHRYIDALTLEVMEFSHNEQAIV